MNKDMLKLLGSSDIPQLDVNYPPTIDGVDTSQMCDSKDISISKFIELRSNALEEELLNSGF